MEQYILKSALVAEIERLREKLKESDFAAYTEAYIIGAKHTLETISDILNTLEVKEVNLEKPFEGIKVQTSMESGSLDEIIVTTKYKAQKRE